jgi:membrane fusion protein, copper/silver efflux system
MNRPLLLRIVAFTSIFAIGYAVGQFRAGGDRPAHPPSDGAGATASQADLAQNYTCSMHPQVRLDAPGNCPICEMPLIVAGSGGAAADGVPTLELSEHALAMASVETTEVELRELKRSLRAVGRIEYNESSLATITTRVDGYAEKLFVNFTGVEIREGDHLAEIYSPELLVAQQELLIAARGGIDDALIGVAKTKLRLLGLTEAQIAQLVTEERTTDRVTLYSPIGGTVIEKAIVENESFDAGDALYRIANLDSVWVYLEIYEYDLPWVRYGQKVTLAAEALPGREFEGIVTFVQPIVDDASRTIRVPVHIVNTDHSLKPGMFVTATIEARLDENGRAGPTGVEGRFTCPMHPQVLVDADGECPHCEMPLERIPGERPATESAPPSTSPLFHCEMECEGEKTYPAPGNCPICEMKLTELRSASATSVPSVLATAILDSGTRRIVYVAKGRGTFESREVVLGPRAGDYFPVLSGLSVGERVVTRGNFLIDSQFQITGHPSLFYPGGLHASMGHAHGGGGSQGDGAAGAPADPKPSAPKPGSAHDH